VLAVQEWRAYLSYQPFIIRTDHKPLTWLNDQKEFGNMKVQRWIAQLSEFAFEIEYKKGLLNVVPDILSRRIGVVLEDILDDDEDEDEENQRDSTPVRRIVHEEHPENQEDEVNDINLYDSETLWYYVKHNQHREGNTLSKRMKKKIERLSRWLEIRDNVRYHKDRRIISDPEERKQLIEQAHTLGHYGAVTTSVRILRKFWWPTVYEDVSKALKSCHACIDYNDRSQGSRVKSRTIHKWKPAFRPFDRVHIDYVGPFPKYSIQGHNGIFTICDATTEWAEAFCVSDKTEETACQCYLNIVSHYGPAVELVSDQGKEFLNKMLKLFCEKSGTIRTITSGYRPQTNAAVEKTNHNLVNALRKLCDGHADDWEDWLPWVLLADRTRYRPRLGMSPMEALYGQTIDFLNWSDNYSSEQASVIQILDRLNYIIEIVHPKLAARIRRLMLHHEAQQKDNSEADELAAVPIGSYVVLLKPKELIDNKLGKRARGGVYKVTGRTKFGNYVLETQRGKPVVTPVHPTRIRVISVEEATRRLASREEEEEEIDEDDPDIFEVEKIIGHKNVNGQLWYKIHWKGYDEESYEPERSVHADELVKKYWESHTNDDDDYLN
jgi:transposase InsO family protein